MSINVEDIKKQLKDFTPEELQIAMEMIAQADDSIVDSLVESLYTFKPPTPREFLDGWLSDDLRASLFPYVVDTFCDIWEKSPAYREVVLYGATRIGKSVLVRLSVIYIIVRLNALKNVHRYYGLSEMSSFAIYLMCFSKKTSKRLLLEPIKNAILHCPKFKKVKFEEHIVDKRSQYPNDNILWCTSSKIGEYSFSNNIHLCLGSSPMDIIGADIILAVFTEINFFIESKGVSEEDVWNVYVETKDRIEGTIGEKYGSMLLLDSSANNRDSIIEDYILNTAKKDPSVYYFALTRWDARPELYPQWKKTRETFKVFKGDRTRPPCIVDETFKGLPGDERNIVDVPIDAYESFKKDIHKGLKNQAGIPTGAANLFFPDIEYVKEQVFSEYVDNAQQPIETPMIQNSSEIIMDIVRPIMMQRDINNTWRMKRAPGVPRWVRVDMSTSDDRTGLAICHPELGDDGAIYCVFDLAVDIRPGKDGINLDAVKFFIRSLYDQYGIWVAGVSSDRYQGDFIKQFVTKDGRDYKLLSVDASKTPYLIFKTKVLNGLVKMGYYINVLNNFRSLIETDKKIDHIEGKRSNEKNKDIGLESKDILDSCSGACADMFQEISKYSNFGHWDDTNRRMAYRYSMQSKNALTQSEQVRLLDGLVNNVANVKRKENSILKVVKK